MAKKVLLNRGNRREQTERSCYYAML